MTTIRKVADTSMTLAEFLEYEDETDYLYELENGKLVRVPTESQLNHQIAIFLLVTFVRLGISEKLLGLKTEIIVSSKTVRIPDLVLISPVLYERVRGNKRYLITLDMPPPELVVEVVSPSSVKQDYEDKPAEYSARGIPEYWIVDPLAQKVTVGQWQNNCYKEAIYTGEEQILSSWLGEFSLTARVLLQGGSP